jgi:L-glutamine-phosphate cytidylyltransferase
MRGVILAAGKGARLNGIVGDKPKCLLRLGAKTLIERQIEALRTVGIDDIVIIVGCQADRVKRTCGRNITYVENPRYQRTNSLYSLWLARPLLLDGFVVLNCDVLFHPQLLTDLLTSRHEDALLIGYADGPLGDEEMKIKTRRGRVARIAKTLPASQADGENVGIAKFGVAGATVLARFLDSRVEAGGLRDWLPRAFAEFAGVRPLHVIGTRGYPWTEIDFPKDYERAVRDVLPAIEHDIAVTQVRVQPETTVVVHGFRLRQRSVSAPLSAAAGATERSHV